ncbi:uncharacterized protein LOC119767666 [Culex quinquefasciatus]|uniref:uncharacterized protein LOC119767666 n=1 Tax=Culex quinquefasciatus TaxID=7176 RepID=UPI0018E3C026|nr:uncharacterized protein LOC119767666 [Culex quinquefasciatus]
MRSVLGSRIQKQRATKRARRMVRVRCRLQLTRIWECSARTAEFEPTSFAHRNISTEVGFFPEAPSPEVTLWPAKYTNESSSRSSMKDRRSSSGVPAADCSYDVKDRTG